MRENQIALSFLFLFLSLFPFHCIANADLWKCRNSQDQKSIFTNVPVQSRDVVCHQFREKKGSVNVLPDSAFDHFKEGLLFDLEKDLPAGITINTDDTDGSRISRRGQRARPRAYRPKPAN